MISYQNQFNFRWRIANEAKWKIPQRIKNYHKKAMEILHWIIQNSSVPSNPWTRESGNWVNKARLVIPTIQAIPNTKTIVFEFPFFLINTLSSSVAGETKGAFLETGDFDIQTDLCGSWQVIEAKHEEQIGFIFLFYFYCSRRRLW